MRYFRLLDDLSIEGKWRLGDINYKSENDIWIYTNAGTVLEIQEDLQISILEKGKSLDLTMAEFEILIANQRVCEILDDTYVQKIPIRVSGRMEKHFILVIKNEVDCIDREKSIFSLWQIGNSIRPDLAGKYRMITQMVVNPTQLKGYDIVRVKDYNVAVIVSEKIKRTFEDHQIKGVTFKDVSPI